MKQATKISGTIATVAAMMLSGAVMAQTSNNPSGLKPGRDSVDNNAGPNNTGREGNRTDPGNQAAMEQDAAKGNSDNQQSTDAQRTAADQQQQQQGQQNQQQTNQQQNTRGAMQTFTPESSPGIDRLRTAEQREMEKQGNRMVQVPERAIWGMGEAVADTMHEAMEMLAKDPDKAHLKVKQVANLVDIQAAMFEDPAKQQLTQQAQNLRNLSQQIEYRQALSKDNLRQPFAQASIALADAYQQAAKMGLDRQDAERTGYALKNAAGFLSVAHTYAERSPSGTVSTAILDADRMGEQIIRTSKFTTQQISRMGESQNQGEGDLAAYQKRMQDDTRQVIDELGQAIRTAEVVASAR